MILKRFSRWLSPSSHQQAAHRLYVAAVSQARQPKLYREYGVADTVDGRFDLIALHVFLLSRALMAQGEADMLRQEMVNCMFCDMDQSLREMGIGDVSIGKKVQKMAYALNGRMETYETSWDNDQALEQALWRNVYRSQDDKREQAAALQRYVRACEIGLLGVPPENLRNGQQIWPQDSQAA